MSFNSILVHSKIRIVVLAQTYVETKSNLDSIPLKAEATFQLQEMRRSAVPLQVAQENELALW